MTGRPDTTDPLDRMEHDGNRFFDLSWLGENGQPAGVLYETASDLAEHVLALVAVARASRVFLDFTGEDIDASIERLSGQLRTDYENDLFKAAQMAVALREALARLDGAR